MIVTTRIGSAELELQSSEEKFYLHYILQLQEWSFLLHSLQGFSNWRRYKNDRGGVLSAAGLQWFLVVEYQVCTYFVSFLTIKCKKKCFLKS